MFIITNLKKRAGFRLLNWEKLSDYNHLNEHDYAPCTTDNS